MKYWLMKSEPEAFSIDDLKHVGKEPWSGVRNYQARNFMRDDMKIGDGILFYHSSCDIPGVVGIARVASKPYADPTQFDPESAYWDPKATEDAPRWFLVDVAYRRKLKRIITLADIKNNPILGENFALIRRGNRLSILPVSAVQWRTILDLE